MFAGFNLTMDKSFFNHKLKSYKEYIDIGEKHLNSQKALYEENMEKYIIQNETIDGSKIQDDWFPEVDADIFLSHAHADKDLINALAGWLNETFKLNCFIDSNIWGYSKELLGLLNDKYSNKKVDSRGIVFDHTSCNAVSEHVNTMLNIALQKMVDRVEAVFLINTSNVIRIFDDSESMNKIYSPWIYSELICSQIVRKKSLEFYRKKKFLKHSLNKKIELSQINESVTIAYNAPTEHLVQCSQYSGHDFFEYFF